MLNIYEIYNISSLVISLRIMAIVCHSGDQGISATLLFDDPEALDRKRQQ